MDYLKEMDRNLPLASVTDEALVRELLNRIGENPDREGLKDTPKRVVKAWAEIFGGYKVAAESALGTEFDSAKYADMILAPDIEFYSRCEHHMEPFFGRVDFAYIPGESKKVVGLSKIPRMIDILARRLQIQERLTVEIAEVFEQTLKPAGVAVRIEAAHFCVRCRGVGKQNMRMVTNHLTGSFKTDPATRSEFFASCGR